MEHQPLLPPRRDPDDVDGDLEAPHSPSYAPLPDGSAPQHHPPISPSGHKRLTIASLLFLLSLVAVTFNTRPPALPPTPGEGPRGARQGVSDKGFIGGGEIAFNWTESMLEWQRTGFHFQPAKNWMNDPNGPLYHMGWYHLFYQYNPDSAVWGNITWGHAVSRDLVHWLYLPIAMVPDSWFDWNGVWTGSATILPDGRIIMLYTGDTDNYVQVQNLAYPANASDPLLLDWVKYARNPVIVPPAGVAPKDFRDPTTAWQGPNGTWRVLLGSKANGTGIALVYQTTDFTSFELLDGLLHSVAGTGMWECVDLYPVSTTGSRGLDTSANGPGVKHVLKASLDDDKHDYYALGTYDPVADKWTPDNPELDVGIGLRYDYGKYYASKTFYDQNKGRRILWGWVGETDSESDDLEKGWSSVQSLPREVIFDNETGTNIIQWPVKEVDGLRLNSTEYVNVELRPGSVVPIDIGSASQLDISAEFEIDGATIGSLVEDMSTEEEDYICNGTVGGSETRGALGPFGVITLADESLSELTPVYFYVAKSNGTVKTWFCTDQSRSSMATSVGRLVYGGVVPVLDGEKFSIRILVDHSIVESFAQGGRTVITARVYPTKAIYGGAKLFLFNNATDVNVTASLKIWEMDSAFIKPFPLDQIY
uniref:Beta-fructofuranosidase n=2 Tax=Kalanchoe fedtschenkoi TaxID=63787 RepID=A0A7N0ZQG7_KALFE